MTTLDFPTAPTVGQTYSVVGSPTYTWDGEKWTASGSASTSRPLLTANRSYFVSPTGSDANDGLTVGTPFLTIQKAFNVVYGTLDLGGFNVAINLADGAYSGSVATTQVGPQVGSGLISLIGNVASPGNVIVTNTADNTLVFLGCAITINGLELRSAGAYGLKAQNRAAVTLGANMRYGTCAAAQLYCLYHSTLAALGGAIVGGATSFIRSSDFGAVALGGASFSLVGTPAFSSAFVLATAIADITAAVTTFTGTGATGTRFICEKNSLIDTGGGGASYFPGSVAGTPATGGQYV